MTETARFFELLALEYASDATLTVRIVELHKGKPELDDFLGQELTPLEVQPGSEVIGITFAGVTEFRSRAEPCFAADGVRRGITDFLFECIDSLYLRQVCPFGAGAKEPARHFGVLTESIVLEVLASSEPKVKVPRHVA